MRCRHKILLALFSILFIIPGLSFTLRAALTDSAEVASDSGVAIDYDALPNYERPLVFVLEIEGAIGTVTDEIIGLGIERAEEEGAELLIIMLDTPGGFTSPTWSICKNILNSGVPVCVYIAPSGSRAGSAGVYMTYSAHFAAMAPSTNIGAAHPVGGGGEEIDSIMNEKITNDAVAQIKAAAETRGRNAEWAEKAVRESVSITDTEALKLNVIDFRADDLDALLAMIDGQPVKLPDGPKTMALQEAKVEHISISFIHKILNLVTQPDIAFLLMSLGGLGIMLELYNPGAILPGVVGAICMILALYAFQSLPLSYSGLALIVLAAIMFIAEIKVVSHGVLTVGGLIALFFGGLMLIDTVDPGLRISMSVLWTVVGCVGGAVGLTSWLIIKAARNRPVIGSAGLIGRTAEVRTGGMIYVSGALWKAVCDVELMPGDKVEVIGKQNLTFKVRKIIS